MDVEDVDQVISYDTPSHPKTYIHRVGRTARVGRGGLACCLIRKALDEKAFNNLVKKPNIEVDSMSLDVEELRSLKAEVDEVLNSMTAKKRTNRQRTEIPHS